MLAPWRALIPLFLASFAAAEVPPEAAIAGALNGTEAEARAALGHPSPLVRAWASLRVNPEDGAARGAIQRWVVGGQVVETPSGGLVAAGALRAQARVASGAEILTLRVRTTVPVDVAVDGVVVGRADPGPGEWARSVPVVAGSHEVTLATAGPGAVAVRLTEPAGQLLEFGEDPTAETPPAGLHPNPEPVVTASAVAALRAAARTDLAAGELLARWPEFPIAGVRVGSKVDGLTLAYVAARRGDLQPRPAQDAGALERVDARAQDGAFAVTRTITFTAEREGDWSLALEPGAAVLVAEAWSPEGEARVVEREQALQVRALQPGDRVLVRTLTVSPMTHEAWRTPVGGSVARWRAQVEVPADWPDVGAADRAGRPLVRLAGDRRVLTWQGEGPDTLRVSRWADWQQAGQGLQIDADRVRRLTELARLADRPRPDRVAAAAAHPDPPAAAQALGLPAKPARLSDKATWPTTPDPAAFPHESYSLDGVLAGTGAAALDASGPRTVALAGQHTTLKVALQAPAGLVLTRDRPHLQATPNWAPGEPIVVPLDCAHPLANMVVEYTAPEGWRLRPAPPIPGAQRGAQRSPTGWIEQVAFTDWDAACAAWPNAPWRVEATR